MNKELKILIVDDETLARTTVRKKLLNFGYSNIQEASNGREAFQMLQQEPPDIIIADIVMAEMDGLELLKAIRAADMDILYILLSGYELFNYAREAITYHASYYLLKPIDDNELYKCIKNAEKAAAQRQKERKEKRQKQQGQNQSAMRQQYLMQMVFQHSPHMELSKQQENALGLSYIYEAFAVVLFRIPEPLEQISDDFMELPLAFFCIENVAQEMMQAKDIICHGFASQRDLCLVCNLPDRYLSCKESRTDFFGILQDIRAFCSSRLHLFSAMGTGFAAERKELYHAFRTALSSVELQSLHQKQAQWKNRLFPDQRLTLKEEQKYQLKDALKKAIPEDITRCLEEIYSPFYYDLRDNKSLMNNISLQLIMLLLEYQKHNDPDKTFAPGDEFELYQEVSSLESVKETLDWFLQKAALCLELQSRADAVGHAKEPSFQEQVQFYIEENYKKQLSLTDIADYFHFTPSYFSRLFKQTFKVTFISYLTEYRVNKAKQLLVSSDMYINEIGREVGFQDTKHFYKIFKRSTGYQPNTYRKQFKTTSAT